MHKQKITFLALFGFAIFLLLLGACAGSGGNQSSGAPAGAGSSPTMVTNQIANSPAAVRSNAGNMANAAAANAGQANH